MTGGWPDLAGANNDLLRIVLGCTVIIKRHSTYFGQELVLSSELWREVQVIGSVAQIQHIQITRAWPIGHASNHVVAHCPGITILIRGCQHQFLSLADDRVRNDPNPRHTGAGRSWNNCEDKWGASSVRRQSRGHRAIFSLYVDVVLP